MARTLIIITLRRPTPACALPRPLVPPRIIGLSPRPTTPIMPRIRRLTGAMAGVERTRRAIPGRPQEAQSRMQADGQHDIEGVAPASGPLVGGGGRASAPIGH